MCMHNFLCVFKDFCRWQPEKLHTIKSHTHCRPSAAAAAAGAKPQVVGVEELKKGIHSCYLNSILLYIFWGIIANRHISIWDSSLMLFLGFISTYLLYLMLKLLYLGLSSRLISILSVIFAIILIKIDFLLCSDEFCFI